MLMNKLIHSSYILRKVSGKVMLHDIKIARLIAAGDGAVRVREGGNDEGFVVVLRHTLAHLSAKGQIVEGVPGLFDQSTILCTSK